ncbi:MAG TPA: AI-2E family transporter [Candidatus Sulfotelmatobacter sp.]|nr:AI-2E family transporter [Candidatus Sulfotelmatobacter sp.]
MNTEILKRPEMNSKEASAAAPEQVIPTEIVEQAAEEVETLHASIKAGTVAQIVVAVIAIIGLIYLLKLFLVTTLAAMLLAYVLEPVVAGLMRLHIPRSIGAFIVVTLAVILALGVGYFSYNRALDFANELPEYSATFRETIGSVRAKADKLADQARSVVEPKSRQKPIPVKVEQPQGVTRVLSENGETILELFMAVGFVPFLVYFMLASKEHVHVTTVRLFPKEHRLLAHRTVGNISVMIRSYILANVVVGTGNALICAIVFWYLGIQYSYFIGIISGFVTLIPYLGMFLALLPPLAAGMGTLHKTGLLTVLITVLGMHAITMNLIYPKFIGSRLKLNPLAVSLSLLFWSWIWGAPGLILAIPLLGAAKIICDHTDSLQNLGCWLGDSIHPT